MAADTSLALGRQNILGRKGKPAPDAVADLLLRHANGLGQSALVSVEGFKSQGQTIVGHGALLQNYCGQLQQENCSGGPTTIFVDFAGMAGITGQELKRLRDAKGWSQGRLAEEARAIARRDGYGGKLLQQSIAGYEAGNAKRVPEWLRYVLEALSVGEHRIASEVQPLDIDDPLRAKYGREALPPINLLGTAIGGEYAGQLVEMTEVDLCDVVGQVERPLSLKNDDKAYALTIQGDSMWPRFRPGRRVIVSPKAPIAIGDDVIVQLLGPPDAEGERRVAQVLIKELVRRSATFVELRQFNPDTTFRVEQSEIASMHKVAGELF